MRRGAGMEKAVHSYEDIIKKLHDLELALNESSMVAITDKEGRIQFANKKFCSIAKCDEEDIIGKNHSIFNSNYHCKQFYQQMWQTIQSGKVWRGEIRNKAKDGTLYWADSTIVPFVDQAGIPYQFIIIRHDITKQKEIEEKMKHMAYFDSLTSLPNRHFLNQWVEDFSKKERTQPEKIAVLYFDLDRFKSINDTLGHAIGDQLLKETSMRLQTIVPKEGVVTRQGGDEFVLILEKMQTKEQIEQFAHHVIQTIGTPFYIGTHKITMSTSVGISYSTIEPLDTITNSFVETLLTQADIAMYHAKQAGGNRYFFNTYEQNTGFTRKYQISQAIKSAQENQEFFLVYQPIVQLQTMEIIGVETLLRWKNDVLGTVSPVEFIPLLEELDEIQSVGKWVLETACMQMKQWATQGLALEKIAVNVSPIQFNNDRFIQDVKEILEKVELDPHVLEIEVTESTIIDAEQSLKRIQELKDLGISIAIDDFGTGYSSLSYLKKMPIDSLKIDKSFIDDLDVQDEVIVKTIIDMARNLNFTVVAEGIEKKEQLLYLQHQQCHKGQGYHLGKPMTALDVEKQLKQKEPC